MNAVQLEFNIGESEESFQISFIQKQVNLMHESMNKVRRKLFAEMTEVKKICLSLKTENESLREQLRELKDAKKEWIYKEAGCLFDVREHQKAC